MFLILLNYCIQIELEKQFKDFYTLNLNLQTEWPGILIPVIPEKALIKDFSNDKIEKRRRNFEYFLQKVISI